MRLGLGSAAAPDASLDELLEVCARRGLAVLELREEDADGWLARLDARSDACGSCGSTGSPADDGAEIRRKADAAGVAVSGFRSDSGGSDLRLARLAAVVGAPVLVGGPCDLTARLERAAGLAAVGAEAAVVLDGAVAGDGLERTLAAGFPLAWDTGDGAHGAAGVGATADQLLARAGERLRHVLIRGGGPETALQEGRGIGDLMGRLALAGYDGTVIVSPSSTRYRVAWQGWLGRRGGWGCGSKASDPSLVRLNGELTTAGGER